MDSKIRQLAGLSESSKTQLDALQSREQLRDNILQVHDQALTNFSKLAQRLEQRLAEVEAKLLKKTELETRVSNLEHDTQTLFDMVQTKLSQAQKETNENVGNIMGILQLFEEKQKHIV